MLLCLHRLCPYVVLAWSISFVAALCLLFFFVLHDRLIVFGEYVLFLFFFFFSSRRRHTRLVSDWSSDVCSSDLYDAYYQRAHLLRAQIVGVVVAGREHVSADHHPPAHFLAETLRARLLVHVDDVAARNAQSVAHAIVAREVRGGFRGRHDVIGRQRVFGMRQRDLDDLGAGGLEPGDALFPQLLDLRRHAVDAIFLRHADLEALDRATDRSFVVGHSTID